MYCVVFLTKFLKNITVHVDSIKELGQLDHLNDQIDLRKVYTVFVGPEGADVDFDRPPVVQHIGKELVFSGCFHAYFIAGFRTKAIAEDFAQKRRSIRPAFYCKPTQKKRQVKRAEIRRENLEKEPERKLKVVKLEASIENRQKQIATYQKFYEENVIFDLSASNLRLIQRDLEYQIMDELYNSGDDSDDAEEAATAPDSKDVDNTAAGPDPDTK